MPTYKPEDMVIVFVKNSSQCDRNGETQGFTFMNIFLFNLQFNLQVI